MTTKTKIIVAVVYSLALVAGGYYLAPEKIKTEIKTVEVEKKKDTTVATTQDQKHKKIVIVTNKKPDGEINKTTTITDDTTSNNSTTNVDVSNNTITTDKTKEVTKSSGHLNISVLAGVNVTSQDNGVNPLVYGAHVSKDLLGPISCGLWGLSNGTIGASAGLTF